MSTSWLCSNCGSTNEITLTECCVCGERKSCTDTELSNINLHKELHKNEYNYVKMQESLGEKGYYKVEKKNSREGDKELDDYINNLITKKNKEKINEKEKHYRALKEDRKKKRKKKIQELLYPIISIIVVVFVIFLLFLLYKREQKKELNEAMEKLTGVEVLTWLANNNETIDLTYAIKNQEEFGVGESHDEYKFIFNEESIGKIDASIVEILKIKKSLNNDQYILLCTFKIPITVENVNAIVEITAKVESFQRRSTVASIEINEETEINFIF